MMVAQGTKAVQSVLWRSRVTSSFVHAGGCRRRWLHHTTSRRMERYKQRRARQLQASNHVGGMLVGFVTIVGGTGSAIAMAYM